MASVPEVNVSSQSVAQAEPERLNVNGTPPAPNDTCHRLVREMDPNTRQMYFGQRSDDSQKYMTNNVSDFLLKLSSKSGPHREFLEAVSAAEPERLISDSAVISKDAEQVLLMEKRAQAAYRSFKDKFPTTIWHCCKKLCFTSIAIDPDVIFLFDALLQIHSVSERLHKPIKEASCRLQRRQKGVGGSDVGHNAPTREERETDPGTDRQIALLNFANFALEVLPFLYGQSGAPDGTPCPAEKLCTQAICSLLVVSRNFLYGRKRASLSTQVSEDELTSIVDMAGVRLRQHRRNGDREGFPAIAELKNFECGCSDPCFAEMPIMRLESEYNEFSKLSKQLKPRRKENRYLLNVMFSPLSNSTVSTCNRALGALYTVTEAVIADVRMVLNAMCSDPSLNDRPFIADVVEGYRKHRRHPMNRYPDSVRERVENHLDMVLRADPAGSTGLNVCRVYSPEINTQE